MNTTKVILNNRKAKIKKSNQTIIRRAQQISNFNKIKPSNFLRIYLTLQILMNLIKAQKILKYTNLSILIKQILGKYI